MAENTDSDELKYIKTSLNITTKNKQLLREAAKRNGVSLTTALNAVIASGAPSLSFRIDREIQITQIPRGGA